MRSLIEHYLWIEDPSLDLVWTIAVVRSTSVDRVVRTYGGDPSQPVEMTFQEAEADAAEQPGAYFNAQAFSAGHHVVVIENNGWSGSVPELGRRASVDDSHYFSFYHSHTGNRVLQAVDGQVTACFDPMFVGYPAAQADLTPDWTAGLEAEFEKHYKATCLAVMEQQTSVAFDRAWLDEKLPTYRIPDPDVLFRNVDNARTP
ncbi:DUF6461 domain-containing protein [Actinokineospora sp. NBRC 105648]|uniref:DUF6461 domain-containing protein n=1 Tax=Actinokineospora sp. NBRC 105648 TaxID=3032206 RepID=UPI0024A255D5|nr:DUF6461 domain-containing protein [Actinokineospora sp. NBRC 105648]GLZ43204.1 hypothetical protein Acsp05_68280 [Actinokineospora sp. NBRC 105648]